MDYSCCCCYYQCALSIRALHRYKVKRHRVKMKVASSFQNNLIAQNLFFFFEFPRGVRRDALTSASSVLKRSLCECFFRTREVRLSYSVLPFRTLQKTSLSLSLLQHKKEAQKHTTDSSSYSTTTRENVYRLVFIFFEQQNERRR